MSSAKQILLVEDEADLRTNLVELLEIKKYAVIAAANGQEALKLLEKYPIDLIVSDILMPGMDGYELLQKVRANVSYANLPFIFLSAKVSKEEIREGMEGGAEDYLTKPIKAVELFKAVEISLNKKEKREAWANHHLETVLNEERNVRFHELRTPLFGVLSILELLHENFLSDEPMARELQADWIEKAFSSAKRLNNSLQKLILFQELGNLGQPQKQELSLFDSLKALRKSGEDIPDFSVHGSDRILDFEPTQWEFVIRELLENGSKFGDSEKPMVINSGENAVEIRNKQGQFDRPQLFLVRPFFQLNRAYLEQQGLGLGLYLSQRYCIQNGYTLQAQVDSQLDFVVTITYSIPD
ncbi:ATP-binding response regulator [Cyclobacterium xiamenense]|uniref:ATP-binding response regulator n=1 Tax=Cyclobacterium xiamenense TaxID=1297121 RepID=UPI0012B94DC7|nr:response regulator [Cyclobacterium xiamenense]